MAQYETDETGMSWPCGSIKAEALEVRALAESRNYSTLNPYLNQKQKVIVEAWFQLPTAAFCLSYLLFSWLAFDGIAFVTSKRLEAICCLPISPA